MSYIDDDATTLTLENPRRGRKRALILLALLAVLLLVFATAFLAGGRDFIADGFEEPDLPETLAVQPSYSPPPAVETVVLEEEPDKKGEGEPKSIDLGGGQTAIDPNGPCAIPDAKLKVAPDPVKMLGNKGSFVIYNCSSGDVSWTAATKPWVALAADAGVLSSGANYRLHFTADTSGLENGPYTFNIKVSQPGYNNYVKVDGTKLGGLVAPGPAPSPSPTVGGFTTGGPTGCAAKCITKAWITTIHGTADVSIEIKTHTAAKIVVQVDTEAPKKSVAGEPYYTSPDVHLASGDYRTKWITRLKPLKASTTYHIVVAAKDSKGGISYQAGTFKTSKPIDSVAAAEPGGCSANCVKNATLTPKPAAQIKVSVSTHVPAKMSLYADGGDPKATSGSEFRTEWTATIKLQHDKKYLITLRVADEQGHQQVHKAQYTTPPDPEANHQNRVLVTFHKIHVSNDADDTFWNRTGEMWFLFAVNGERQSQLETGERKVRSPEWVSLDTDSLGSGRSVLIENAPDLLSIRVQGKERDKHLPGFCSTGDKIIEETSGRETIPHCWEVEWNTAEGLVDLHANTDGGALPPCYGFDVTGDLCVLLKATGDDPTFDVYITIDFLE